MIKNKNLKKIFDKSQIVIIIIKVVVNKLRIYTRINLHQKEILKRKKNV